MINRLSQLKHKSKFSQISVSAGFYNCFMLWPYAYTIYIKQYFRQVVGMLPGDNYGAY